MKAAFGQFEKLVADDVLNILAALEKHHVVQDIAMDLAEIASASSYVRAQMEQALEKAPSVANETRPAGDDDEPSMGDSREAVSS